MFEVPRVTLLLLRHIRSEYQRKGERDHIHPQLYFLSHPWSLIAFFPVLTHSVELILMGTRVEIHFWFFLGEARYGQIWLKIEIRLINWTIVLRLDTGRALRQVRGMRGMRAAAHYHTETVRFLLRVFAVISKTLSSFEDLRVCNKTVLSYLCLVIYQTAWEHV